METKQKIGCGFTILISLLVLGVFIGLTLWTDRTLDFWCTYFAHHFVNIPMWLSALVTLLMNGICLVLNVITEIIRLIIGS